jgi:SAM-dependent methyltransferase
MKQRALDFLVCPTCRVSLDLEVEAKDAGEIMSGALLCTRCERGYPIILGIPRFVDFGDYAASFGYQWRRFREVQIDSLNGTRESETTLFDTTGWDHNAYKGSVVLDAGVGAGRFADVVSRHGGEVIGVDLTDAVDAAFENIGRRENVHLVQADIFSMPVRNSAFDLVYSIGVLHHTPNPAQAFEHVARAVKPGGHLAVYLYHGYGPEKKISDLYRNLTTRMPQRLMLTLSWIAVPYYYLCRIPMVGRLFRLALPMSMHSNSRWRWLDTFDWYTPKYQWKFDYPIVYRWFQDNGFQDMQIFDEPIRMRGTRQAQ